MSEAFQQERIVQQVTPERIERLDAQPVPDPDARYEPFPLTDVQKAFWLGRGSAFALGNVGCHVYGEFDVTDVDRRMLQAAWQKLIDRHDMLRAVVRTDGMQQVLPSTPHYEIKHLSLRGLDDANAQAEFERVRARLSHQVFAPDQWPLFELRTTEFDDRTVLHFSLDMLFVDFFSLQLLVNEWSQLTFDDPYLAPLEISFRDYVLAAMEARDSRAYQLAKDYWLQRVDTLPASPRLPLAKTPSAVTRPRFVRRESVIERSVWSKLKSRSAKAQLTPSGVLMAAFARILAAWSASPHFTLNTTLFQRPALHPQIYRVVGDFTTILLLEISCEDAHTFEDLAQRIATQFRSDLEHRSYGGLELLQEIAKRKDPNRPPSMPVVFTSALAQSMPGWQSVDRVGELTYGITQTPQVYLDHQVFELGGNLHITWDAVEELFPPDLLSDMFGAFSDYVRRLAEDETAWSETNESALASLRKAYPSAFKDSIAIATVNRSVGPENNRGNSETSPADLAAIEAALRRHPLVADVLVIESTDSRKSAIGYVVPKAMNDAGPIDAAPWRDGALISPHASRTLSEVTPELRRFISEAEQLERKSTEIIVDTFHALGLFKSTEEAWTAEQIVECCDLQRQYTGLIARWLTFLASDGILVRKAEWGYACAEPFAGRPHPAGVTAAAPGDDSLVAYFDECHPNLLKVLRGELSPLELLFPGGEWRIAEALYQSNPVARRINQQAAKVVQELADGTDGAIRVLELGAGIGSATSTLLPILPRGRTSYLFTDVTRFFHEEAEKRFSRFQFVEYGVVDALLDPFKQGMPPYHYHLIVAANVMHNADDPAAALAQLRPLLAPGGVILLIEATRNTRAHAVTIGLIDGLNAMIADDERPFLPLSHWVEALEAAGYEAAETSRNPSDTANDFGLDFLVARAPAPSVAEQHESFEKLRVSLTEAGLKALLSQRLKPAAMPGHVFVLEAFPLGADGKLDRAALPTARALDHPASGPAGETERTITEIWSMALGHAAIGLDDNFLEFGGDSLIAVRIIAVIRDRFHLEVRAQMFFEAPTIRKMAAEIDRRVQERDQLGVDAEPAQICADADPTMMTEPFPLTEIQEAYWIGRSSGLELGNVGAHFYLELEGRSIDRNRLENAWQRLIERHGMLRTVVLPEGRQQMLEPVPKYRIAFEDLAGLPQEQAGRLLAEARERLSHKLYSGERWPPFEFRLTRLAPDRSRLQLSFDLLVVDFWSLRLLMRELLTLYTDPDAELEALGISFRDYMLAASGLKDSEQWKRSLSYWIARVPELPPPPELPLLRDPATIARPRFCRRAQTLAAAEWNAIKDCAKARDLTPSSVLLGAFTAVLASWSRRSQLTVNLTLFQRFPMHPQVNQIVGDFTSTLLLSSDWLGARSFDEHAHNIQAELWTALDHQHVSGVRVIREWARHNNGGMRPSMPVVFTSGLGQDLDEVEQLQEGVFGKVIYNISQTPQVWLDHQVAEQRGALLFNWDAVEDLFPPGLLDDMFSTYCDFLRRLAQSDAAWSEPTSSLISSAQLSQRRLINDTAAPIPAGLLHEPFLTQVRERPKHLAIATWERALSYEDLHRQSCLLARRLREMGVGPNRLVAVAMEKGWEQIVAVLGILQAGAAYLPVDPDLPQERRWLLLQLADVEIVVTQPCLVERLEWPTAVTCVPLDWQDRADGDAGPDDAPLAPTRAETDLAYVIFTSGSTGEPKGVMIEHRAALNTILDINERFAVGPDDRVLALSSLSFDLSVYDIFGTLAAGATIVMPHPSSRREPADWAELVVREKVTIWNSVPALLEMLADHVGTRKPLLGNSLRLAMLSGDWIPITLGDRICMLVPGMQVISLGGATEASIWSIAYPIGTVGEDWKSIPYGRPLRNQRMHVLNGALDPCPTWVPGDIYISGAGLARGYWKDEARTCLQFFSHPQTGERLYRTGDLGRYLPAGDIEFLGREDDQVKVQGHRIELGEIEAALQRHPAVKAAVVTAVSVRAGLKHLVGYVVADGVTVPELTEHLQRTLPAYMVPNVWKVLDSLPLTANGKVDRRALPVASALMPAGDTDDARADDKTLGGVIALIVEELGEQSIGQDTLDPTRNLLTLGATSMDMVRIAVRLEKEFGFRPSFQDFARQPTAAALARLVAQHRPTAAHVSAVHSSTPVAQRRGLELIVEPQALEDFHREERGIRAFAADWGALPLERDAVADADEPVFQRRTVRKFLPGPVPIAAVGAWLAKLRRTTVNDGLKYAYGSAGGCYPVQTYLHVKQDGIVGLPAGTFYYHPVEHSLVPLTVGADLDPAVHVPFGNRPIFEQARFSLFFVNQPRAIEPVYGDLASRFSTLEAGAMAHALENTAGRFGLGVCAIGWLDFEAIHALLHLEEGQELLHAHVGGLADLSSDPETWEEGVI